MGNKNRQYLGKLIRAKWSESERNRWKFATRAQVEDVHGVPFGFYICHFGVIQYTCLKMHNTSKTTGCRATLIEVWESRVVVICIWNTFDVYTFDALTLCNVILVSFSALVSDWCVTHERVAVEQSRVNLGF